MGCQTNDKDLLLLSACFFLVFLAFGTAQTLESSLHTGAGGNEIGTAALGTVYAAFTVSNLFAPRVLGILGIKRALTAGFSTYVVFVASNLYYSWATMIPSAVLVGIGAAVLWSAQGAYLAAMAPTQDQASRASGIFFTIYQSSNVVGNLMAYFVLGTDSSQEAQEGVPESTVNALFVLFTLSACGGATLSTILSPTSAFQGDVMNPSDFQPLPTEALNEGEDNDNLMLYDENDHVASPSNEDVSASLPLPQEEHVVSMFTILHVDSKLRHLVLVFFFSGIAAVFVWSEFTAFVVKPILGEVAIPLTMIAFTASNAIFSALFGRLATCRPTLLHTLLFAGCGANLAAVSYIFFLLDAEQTVSLAAWATVLTLAVVFAFADASMNTLLTALLASRYDGSMVQIAFAHFRLWQSMASSIAFFLSASLSLPTKALATIAAAVLAMIGVVRS